MKLYEIVLVIHPGGWQCAPRIGRSEQMKRWVLGARTRTGHPSTPPKPVWIGKIWREEGKQKASDQNIKQKNCNKNVKSFPRTVSKLEMGSKDNVLEVELLFQHFSRLSSPPPCYSVICLRITECEEKQPVLSDSTSREEWVLFK